MHNTTAILPLLGIFIALSHRGSMSTETPQSFKEKLLIFLSVWAAFLPAIVISTHMKYLFDVVSWQDTVATCLAAFAIGIAPLALFYLFAGALHLTRQWEAKHSLSSTSNS